MHFFYLDESGDTGGNLLDPNQPIFVLGGISLRDEGWNTTQERYQRVLEEFFGGPVPSGFELHANRLLAPDPSDSTIDRFTLEERVGLAKSLLQLLEDRKHGVHFVAFDKRKISEIPCGLSLDFNPSWPYPLGFDYLITYVNDYTKRHLGRSARAMMIFDQKKKHRKSIEGIIHNRRFLGPRAHRVKWISEFAYSVDSRHNPMVQLSDLVIFIVRRFLEIEYGHRDGWKPEAKQFYAESFARIYARLKIKKIVERTEPRLSRLNEYLGEVYARPVGQWKKRYAL